MAYKSRGVDRGNPPMKDITYLWENARAAGSVVLPWFSDIHGIKSPSGQKHLIATGIDYLLSPVIVLLFIWITYFAIPRIPVLTLLSLGHGGKTSGEACGSSKNTRLLQQRTHRDKLRGTFRAETP